MSAITGRYSTPDVVTCRYRRRVELAASGLAAPLVALSLWLDFLIDAASWLLDFLDDAASWSLNFLDDAASWFVNFLDDAASWSLNFLADAASWSLNLTIGPPGEVLRRLDVELWPGVKLRLGRRGFSAWHSQRGQGCCRCHCPVSQG